MQPLRGGRLPCGASDWLRSGLGEVHAAAGHGSANPHQACSKHSTEGRRRLVLMGKHPVRESGDCRINRVVGRRLSHRSLRWPVTRSAAQPRGSRIFADHLSVSRILSRFQYNTITGNLWFLLCSDCPRALRVGARVLGVFLCWVAVQLGEFGVWQPEMEPARGLRTSQPFGTVLGLERWLCQNPMKIENIPALSQAEQPDTSLLQARVRSCFEMFRHTLEFFLR